MADVRGLLAQAEGAGLSTHVLHTIDDRNEIWSHDRRLLHDDLVHSLYAQADGVPRDHHAVIAGGLPAAGKTSVLAEHADIDLTKFLMINPDLIKGELARRGLIPEVGGLTPMEASRLAHEESSHLAKRVAHRAEAEGTNLIWDVTMSNAGTCAARLDVLRSAGYTRVDSIFVDIPVEVSLGRADARHREGHDEHRAGVGLGGRFLPGEMILAQADPAWGSINRANFEQVKERFTTWARYDNSAQGRPAVLVADSTGLHRVMGSARYEQD